MSKGRVWNRGKHDGTGLSRKKPEIKRVQLLLKLNPQNLRMNLPIQELIP